MNTQRGFSLVDIIIGSAIAVIVFTAIIGLFKANVQLVGQTRAEASAVSIATAEIEKIRSLPYSSVGTVGGIPAGGLPQTASTTMNNVVYTKRIFVRYMDAPQDGTGGSDTNGIITDYKAAKVTVSWTIRGVNKSMSLITNIVPPGIETTAGGGTLTVNVFDALAAPVVNAEVRIQNASTSPAINLTTYTDTDGIAMFPGTPAASGYSISATKMGYSTAQTYSATAALTNPTPPNVSVVLAMTSTISLAIDRTNTETFRTLQPVSPATTTDTFADSTRVASSSKITVASGAAALTLTAGTYPASGTLLSTAIAPTYIATWRQLSWNDSEPAGTGVLYRIYYDEGGVPTIVPDAALAGNAAGFSTSPISLLSIPTATYKGLRVHATLTSSNPLVTPSLNDWSLTYDEGPMPIPNIPISMRSTKTKGTGPGGAPVYKFQTTLNTGAQGSTTVSSLEWDTYVMDIASATGYDIAQSCPPLPRSILPGTTGTTDITLVPQTTNSLRVAVYDTSLNLVPDATIRVTRTGFTSTKTSSTCGQTFFSGLGQGTVAGANAYTVNVSKTGFSSATTTNVEVTGRSTINMTLSP